MYIDAIRAHFGEGDGAMLTYIFCYSHQSSFLDCSFDFYLIPYGSLFHRYDIGVRCEGNLL